MADKTFYDIHLHTMNLSHPNLRAFIQRFKLTHRWLLLLAPLAIPFVERKMITIKNLLSVMENDIGSFLLLMEDCLKGKYLKGVGTPLWQEGKLKIGGNVYTKIVLTPLMMDFGNKDTRDQTLYYSGSPQKPITEQVIDIFNGIRAYKNNPGSEKIFEIYPFMGMNTKNYDLARIKKMLDKYFKDYTGSSDDLSANMGKFDGDIENIKSNFFAGIKVYPPLGFDPWPDSTEDNWKDELDKVKCLYSYCCDKKIPVTSHCSDGGFKVAPKKKRLKYSSPERWEKVLKNYPELKLNLAHFGKQGKRFGLFPRYKWGKKILKELIPKYDNLYVDFSFTGVDAEYYKCLREILNDNHDKLKERILFGSDFMINLLSIDSYSEYWGIFANDTYLGDSEKNEFCSVNPERFLFRIN
jgi:hypothetical protein